MMFLEIVNKDVSMQFQVIEVRKHVRYKYDVPRSSKQRCQHAIPSKNGQKTCYNVLRNDKKTCHVRENGQKKWHIPLN
jgi:hypothetical protein